jgi:ribosomal protein S7
MKKAFHKTGVLKSWRNRKKALAEEILLEARKIVNRELKKLSNKVLSEATTLGRWEKKPFYIA